MSHILARKVQTPKQNGAFEFLYVGGPFMGVLAIGALLFGVAEPYDLPVYTRAPDFC